MRLKKVGEQYNKKHKEYEPRKLVRCLVLLPCMDDTILALVLSFMNLL